MSADVSNVNPPRVTTGAVRQREAVAPSYHRTVTI